MKNSIKTKSQTTQDGAEAQVFTNLSYASYVEFGTGPRGNGTYPYSIKGYKPRYKAEKWKAKIPNVGVRWVSGQAAQPFLTPAYLHAKNTDEVEQEVIKSIEQDIRKLGGK